MRLRILIPFLMASLLPAAQWVLIRTTEGTTVEGETSLAAVKLGSTALKIGQILSVHNAAEASAAETAKIDAGLAAIAGADRKGTRSGGGGIDEYRCAGADSVAEDAEGYRSA